MWDASSTVAAAGSSAVGTVLVPIIGAAITVLAAVVTGLFTLRGSTRSTDAQREKDFDDRLDKEISHLRAENGRLEALVDQQQAQLARARWLLASHGVDPGALDNWEAGSGRHRTAAVERGVGDRADPA